MDVKKLSEPFSADDVEWRIANTTKDKTRGMVVPYIDSRAIQQRLDETVGAFNWKTEYIPWHSVGGNLSQLCMIYIYNQERQEWISKCDGAENTDIEPVKGGISDSFKRAAVHWGIGRYLYSLNSMWVEVDAAGKGYVIKDSEKLRLKASYEKAVKALFSSEPPKSKQTPKEEFTFDYAVKKADKQQFSSGAGMVLQLITPNKGETVTAYLTKEDNNITEGVCLKNVSLSKRPSASGAKELTVLGSYEIAA